MSWNQVLNGAASRIFGCGPPAGRGGPNGLVWLALTGSVTDIALPDGSQGRLAGTAAVAPPPAPR